MSEDCIFGVKENTASRVGQEMISKQTNGGKDKYEDVDDGNGRDNDMDLMEICLMMNTDCGVGYKEPFC